MLMAKRIPALLLALLLLLALTACGGEPVAFQELPVHPDASPLEAGSHPMADTVADSFRQAVGQEGVQIDLQLYALPAETSWDEVQSFYAETLEGDWKSEPRLAQDTSAFKTVGWARGAFAGEQGLAVGYGPALLGSPPFMMVALFSE
jgi:hypothetical protein